MTLPRSFADRFLYAPSRIQVSDPFPHIMSNEHRLNDQTKQRLFLSQPKQLPTDDTLSYY
jgi:hypothetical protein